MAALEDLAGNFAAPPPSEEFVAQAVFDDPEIALEDLDGFKNFQTFFVHGSPRGGMMG